MSSSSNPHKDSIGFTTYDYEPSPVGCVVVYQNFTNINGSGKFIESCNNSGGERFGCNGFNTCNFNTTAEYDIWDTKYNQTFTNVTKSKCKDNSADKVLAWCKTIKSSNSNYTSTRSTTTKGANNSDLSIKVFNNLQLIMFIVLLSAFTF